jgi:uncharacterized protein
LIATGAEAVLLPLATYFGVALSSTGLFSLLNKTLKHHIENYRIPCPDCGNPMEIVDEITDNRYLNEAEIAEERAGGMDYEFWKCLACNHLERLEVKLSKADACTKCRRRTLTRTTETLETATTSHSGREKITFTCKNPPCGYSRVEERTIPRISSSSSSSSGGSSSGGSSFGGGSSGGGGASRGW